MPILSDLNASGYKSVVSSKNVVQTNGVLSDFNATGGLSRQHEDGAHLQDDDILNRSQVRVSYDNSVFLQ